MSRLRIACIAGAVAALAAAVVYVVTRADVRPPPDHAIRFVPSDATAYLHLTTDLDADQVERARKALDQLPSFDLLRDQVLARASAGGRLDLAAAARDWLGDEAAVAQLPVGPRRRTPAIAGGSIAAASVAVKRALVARNSEPLLLLAARDQAAAKDFIARATTGVSGRAQGVELRGGGGVTFALDDGFVLAGGRAAVVRALDTKRDGARALDRDPTYKRLTGELPPNRLVNTYLTGGALLSGIGADAGEALGYLAGRPAAALGASFGIEGETGRVAVRADAGAAPPGCRSGEGGKPKLVNDAPASTAALLEVAHADCAVRRLAARPRSAPARALERFARAARRVSRLSLEDDLLPIADGPGELLVTGSDAPVLTLLLDEVPKRRALERMDRLQPALIDLVGSEDLGRVPSFGARELGGVTAITSELSPGLELSYAQFGNRFAVSTQPDGIRAAVAKGGLTASTQFKRVLGDIPGRPSSVLFLDLDRLLALGDQVGLSEDAGFLAIRDDLQRLAVVGATFTREGQQTNAEIRFNIP